MNKKEKDFKPNNSEIEALKINIELKDLDEHISGSPYRTVELVKKFGINLESDVDFGNQKDFILSIVDKSNQVVHHNDDASGLTNEYLNGYIDAISSYIATLDRLICTLV